MSVSFSLVHVAPMPSLSSIVRRLGDLLLPLGFSPGGRAWSFEFGHEDHEFMDSGDEGMSALQLFAGPSRVDESRGIGVAFQNENTALSARLARQPDGSGIGFIEMSDRALYRYFAEQEEARLRNLFSACANACEVSAAFGAFELEWVPYTEMAVMDAIQHGPPEYEGRQPPFALLRKSDHPRAEIGSVASPSFIVHDEGLYWYLQQEDISKVYASIER